jgi:hypothetical protein
LEKLLRCGPIVSKARRKAAKDVAVLSCRTGAGHIWLQAVEAVLGLHDVQESRHTCHSLAVRYLHQYSRMPTMHS